MTDITQQIIKATNEAIKRQNFLSYLQANFNDKIDIENYNLEDYEQHFAEELIQYFEIDTEDEYLVDLAYDIARIHFENLKERDNIK